MTAYAAGATRRTDFSQVAVRASGVALMTATWISGAIFGLYILAAYGGALQDGQPERWNETLPHLYGQDALIAAIGIGVHFATGAVLLLLGPIQFIGAIRRLAPAVHRWTGRIYAGSALLAGIGGLVHILAKGTIGGMTMDIGFGIYGGLMILCAVQTVRHAIARRLDVHRAWAIRLFALAVGSWLYRVEYALWNVFAGGIGSKPTFDGWFDIVMIFFFFVPNLIVAELYIRAQHTRSSTVMRVGSSVVMLAAAGLVAFSGWFLALYAWGPAVLERFV